MEKIITTIQVISLVILIASVLLQQKGIGLSGVFGGSSNYYQTKRGAEKFLFYVTVFTALTFFLVTLWQIFATK